MSTPALLSAAQVVQLARKEMQNAVEEEQNSAGGPHGMGNGLTPGITIDMSHRNIQTFPEEVVDIIKTELERYIRPWGLNAMDSIASDANRG